MNVRRILWHSQVWTVSNRRLIDICLKHSFYTVSFISNLYIFVFLLALTPWDSSESYSSWALPWLSGLIWYNNNNNNYIKRFLCFNGKFHELSRLCGYVPYLWNNRMLASSYEVGISMIFSGSPSNYIFGIMSTYLISRDMALLNELLMIFFTGESWN